MVIILKIIIITIIIIIIIIIINVQVKTIPLVIGSLGAIPKQFGRLKQIGITAGTVQVQKIVLLGTARILTKVLEI